MIGFSHVYANTVLSFRNVYANVGNLLKRSGSQKSGKKRETKTLDKGLEAGDGGKMTGEQSWGQGVGDGTWSLKEPGLRDSVRKPCSRGSIGNRPEFCS